MIRTWYHRRTRGEGPDEGIALVSVIAISSLLAILVVSATAYAVGSMRKASTDEEWNAALAAAYAGVEEYQSRLANDPSYFILGNPASQYSVATGSTVTLPEVTGGPAAVNPAFGVGAAGTWAEVPGSDGGAHFRYEVDNSEFYTTGTLRIRSTGRAAGQTRTLVADLRQDGFIAFLYFTKYEIQDPLISGADPVACDRYRYNGRSTANPPTGCGAINFVTGDVINGPLHTNDGMQVSGNPEFKGWTTTSYNPATGPRYYGTGSPTFPAMPGGKMGHQAEIGMPQTNAELKKETRPDLPSLVPRPGCLYTGPTTITFLADGRVTVRSPFTKYTSPVAGVNNTGCGTPGSSGLGSATGQTFAAPDNNVIFVQNVPADTTDANYWSSTDPGLPVCLPQDNSSATGRNAAGNPVGYPLAGEYVANDGVYGCRSGDAFVEGTVNAKVTVAAENYIYVTDDITYQDENDDVLGLVGQNAVFVHNPREQNATSTTSSVVVETRNNQSTANAKLLTGYPYSNTPSSMNGNNWTCTRESYSGGYRYDCVRTQTTTTWAFSPKNSILNVSDYTDREIHAAILSVAHTFMVQNYNVGGPRGDLTVYGAIAQKFRGPVGTGGETISTGYYKDYNYDQRFRYVAPPKYLSPVTTTYGVTVWVEVSPVMTADGSYS